MFNKKLLLTLKNVDTSIENLTITIGEPPSSSSVEEHYGYTSTTSYGGKPWGKLSPNKFLNTGINRLFTFHDWNADRGKFWHTFLCFYSFSFPSNYSIRVKRLDTNASVDLKPYPNAASRMRGYRNTNSHFFSINDVGKVIKLQLKELK